MPQQYNLQRFIDAQEASYPDALAEVRAGKKRSHWIWYIFPQVAGLGLSEFSKRYALKDLQEAGAFLQHPVLGARLLEITNALLQLKTGDAHEIFGSPDDTKLRSSMTLFAALPNADTAFQSVIDKFFGGGMDMKTIAILQNIQ